MFIITNCNVQAIIDFLANYITSERIKEVKIKNACQTGFSPSWLKVTKSHGSKQFQL